MNWILSPFYHNVICFKDIAFPEKFSHHSSRNCKGSGAVLFSVVIVLVVTALSIGLPLSPKPFRSLSHAYTTIDITT